MPYDLKSVVSIKSRGKETVRSLVVAWISGKNVMNN
jgi:hypothetical protein